MATPASAACVSFFDLPNRTQALHEPGVDYLRCFPVVPPGLVPLIAGTQGILPGLKYAAAPRLRPEQMSAGCPIVDVLCQGGDGQGAALEWTPFQLGTGADSRGSDSRFGNLEGHAGGRVQQNRFESI